MVEPRFVRKRKGIEGIAATTCKGESKGYQPQHATCCTAAVLPITYAQVNYTHYEDVLGAAVLFVAEISSTSMGSVCLVLPLPTPTPSVMSIRLFLMEKAILLQVGT